MFKHLFVVAAMCVALLSSVPAWALAGAYQTYDQKTFADNSASQRVLFFYADWCPSCRSADAILQKAQLPENVIIYKVNYDQAAELKAQYGIMIQDTFVLVNAKGEKITQWIGIDYAMEDHFKAPDQTVK